MQPEIEDSRSKAVLPAPSEQKKGESPDLLTNSLPALVQSGSLPLLTGTYERTVDANGRVAIGKHFLPPKGDRSFYLSVWPLAGQPFG